MKNKILNSLNQTDYQVEIEKTYLFNQDDYKKIKGICTFIKKKEIIDDYFDTTDFLLYKNGMRLRKRNGTWELKIKSYEKSNISSSKEINSEEEIRKLLLQNFGITPEQLEIIIHVEATREKYTYTLDGEILQISIDSFQYGKKYEIELNSNNLSSQSADELIEKFRSLLGLQSHYSESASKVDTCAKNQNQQFYKLIKELDFKNKNKD